MALGRLWEAAKYSHGVWEQFADIFKDFQQLQEHTRKTYLFIWIYGYMHIWTSNSKRDICLRSGQQIKNGIFGAGRIWDPGPHQDPGPGRDPAPGTRDLGPGTRDLGPGPGDPDPGTRTRTRGPGTGDLGTRTRDLDPGNRTRGPGPGDPDPVPGECKEVRFS